MLIESISIMYLGIGFLFVVLICAALETIVEQTKNLLVGEKKDPIDRLRPELDALKADLNALHLNRLRPELDALKADLNALKTKLELARYSPKMTEPASLVPVLPSTSQAVLEDAWLRGNREGQSLQGGTWSRDELASDASIIPTLGHSTPGDTWTRAEGLSDFSVVPTVSCATDEDTWIRDGNTPPSPDRDQAANLLTMAFSQEEHRSQVARNDASASVIGASLIRKMPLAFTRAAAHCR
jgi:hypothetical protein